MYDNYGVMSRYNLNQKITWKNRTMTVTINTQQTSFL